MLHKFVAILAVFLSFIATDVLALGLGAVSVESSLNQPLRVRIEVLQLGDTRLQDVNIQVASPEDFKRFNIERSPFLNNIRFATDVNSQGNFVILSTNQIVREPYLSVILETRWTNGRLLSEHTILLDLPVYVDEATTASPVRQAISTVLTPQSSRQDVESAASTPTPTPTVASTSSIPSVQPIIQPEVIAPPNAEDTGAIKNTTVEASDSVESSTEPDSSQAEASAALTQTAADELEVELAEDLVDDSEPLTELDEEPADVASDPSEELADDISDGNTDDGSADDSNAGELAAESVSDDSAFEEQAAEADPVEEVAPETITTGYTDTLSGIALRIRPDESVSIQQAMLAIQELNPDAFIGGNINRLRNGEVLRVPSIRDIQAIGQREAVAEVRRQNQLATTNVQPLAAPSNTVPGQDEEASGQLSVVTSDPDADSTNGAGISVDSDDNALDDRIGELENQLALREEEADRARIEKEELEFRLAELDEQIAAAQEIIRLRDLQLAQLQQSLANAAAEAELLAQESKSAVPISAEVTATETQPAGYVDSLLKTLMGNSIALIAAAVVVILALAGFLVMRNKGKQSDPEGLDSINENEFKGVTDAQNVADDSVAAMGSEFHDYKQSELDSELDEIFSIGEQKQEGLSGIPAVPVLDAEEDVALGVDILIERGQLEHADFLLAQVLKQNPEDVQLLLKQLEITVARGDLSVFEVQAERLQNQNNPAVDEKIDVLRKELSAYTIIEPPVEDTAASEAETLRQKAETTSFLDDLGIDLEAFEDDSFHLAGDPIEEHPASKPLDVSSDELAEESDPDAIDMMFDPGVESNSDPVASEPAIEAPAEGEKTASSKGVEFDGQEADGVTEVELSVETAADEVVFETLEFDQNAAPELAGGDSKDLEDLEIDTLEFDVAEPEQEVPTPAKPEEELDLEAFTYETPTSAAPPVEEVVRDGSFDESELDDNVLDFDFDKADINAETELDAVADPKGFDFDDDSTAAVVEKSTASDDEISLDFGDQEGADDAALVKHDSATAAIDDDFDFDLNELEINTDDFDISDAEIELTDDDLLDLDSEESSIEDVNEEGVVTAGKSPKTPSTSPNPVDDDIAFGFDDDFEVAETPADIVVGTDTDAGDDLDFLAEDDIAFETPDYEGDPESLSDEDETATKLELAYAYQKMGDSEGAQEILREVISEGTEAQIKEAQDLIVTLSSSAD
jgi:pilus assembly protein FimV